MPYKLSQLSSFLQSMNLSSIGHRLRTAFTSIVALTFHHPTLDKTPINICRETTLQAPQLYQSLVYFVLRISSQCYSRGQNDVAEMSIWPALDLDLTT